MWSPLVRRHLSSLYFSHHITHKLHIWVKGQVHMQYMESCTQKVLHEMCMYKDDWNTDLRRWLKRSFSLKGTTLKKYHIISLFTKILLHTSWHHNCVVLVHIKVKKHLHNTSSIKIRLSSLQISDYKLNKKLNTLIFSKMTFLIQIMSSSFYWAGIAPKILLSEP